MFRFEPWIFPTTHTDFDKITDPNKDANDKGTKERFFETLGKSLDDELQVPLENIPQNVLEPHTAYPRFIPLMESGEGYLKAWAWFYQQPINTRRNIVAIMPRIFAIRGTIRAHQVMMRWIGLNIVITEPGLLRGFDSPVKFDSTARRFDSFTNTLGPYSIALTGAGPSLSTDQIQGVTTFLEFNQPIDAILTGITYNGNNVNSSFNFFQPDFNYSF